MKAPEYYSGREQTYLKHYFLERYLERVAYNILSFQSDFVYVDGFSGPWKSTDEANEDTSFVIALNKLVKVRDGLRDRGKNVTLRCLFIEKDRAAFAELERAVGSISNVRVEILFGAFERLVPEILSFIGNSFSLVFIDPTGWSGIDLKQIGPILKHRPGEVLLNFMFDHINRFLDDPRPEVAATFDPVFGVTGWNIEVETLVREGLKREDAILTVYQDRFRRAGVFDCVTTTRILKPLAERSYFHLVYGTRHWKGLVEFRQVEEKFVHEQEEVRGTAKQLDRFSRTGQAELFTPEDAPNFPRSFEAERTRGLELALARLGEVLEETRRVDYEVILAKVLEIPLVWERDIKAWVMEMRAAGKVEIEGMTGRERTPKPGHVIVRR